MNTNLLLRHSLHLWLTYFFVIYDWHVSWTCSVIAPGIWKKKLLLVLKHCCSFVGWCGCEVNIGYNPIPYNTLKKRRRLPQSRLQNNHWMPSPHPISHPAHQGSSPPRLKSLTKQSLSSTNEPSASRLTLLRASVGYEFHTSESDKNGDSSVQIGRHSQASELLVLFPQLLSVPHQNSQFLLSLKDAPDPVLLDLTQLPAFFGLPFPIRSDNVDWWLHSLPFDCRQDKCICHFRKMFVHSSFSFSTDSISSSFSAESRAFKLDTRSGMVQSHLDTRFPFNAERQAGSCEYHRFEVFWFDLTKESNQLRVRRYYNHTNAQTKS